LILIVHLYQMRGISTTTCELLFTIRLMTKRSLIAEDRPVVVAALEEFLNQNGFRVVGASQRWDRVLGDYENLLPDIRLIDVHVPQRAGQVWMLQQQFYERIQRL
jgi:DNA-binding NarL/FixJ family response regulator